MGFAMPRPLPCARCALTAPFHFSLGRSLSDLLSVALSLTLPKQSRRTLSGIVVSLEPGLSSPLQSKAATARPSGTAALKALFHKRLAKIGGGLNFLPIFGQQQAQQQSAALPVDHPVQPFGTKAPLKRGNSRLTVGHIITKPLQR
jgi:hypothetical protein